MSASRCHVSCLAKPRLWLAAGVLGGAPRSRGSHMTYYHRHQQAAPLVVGARTWELLRWKEEIEPVSASYRTPLAAERRRRSGASPDCPQKLGLSDLEPRKVSCFAEEKYIFSVGQRKSALCLSCKKRGARAAAVSAISAVGMNRPMYYVRSTMGYSKKPTSQANGFISTDKYTQTK